LSRLAVFGYGSLANPASAGISLGRDVEIAAIVRLAGWRRRWTVFRDNRTTEKTFALADGTVPPYVIGLNLERDAGHPGANGVLIEITEAEADRLDLREMRYDRADATADVRPVADGDDLPSFDRVIAYTAKPEQHASAGMPGAIVIAEYVRTVEAAFAALGSGHLDLYRDTTDPTPVEPSEAHLVADDIPEGNPRRW
jgi:hypothetical protein